MGKLLHSLIGLVLLSTVACFGQAFSFSDPAFMMQYSPASAGASCVTVQDSVTGAIDFAGSIGASAATQYRAQKWTPTNSYTICKITVHIEAVLSPVNTLTGYLYDHTQNNSGVIGTDYPTNILATTSAFNLTGLSSASYTDVTLTFITPVAITAGHVYVIVLHEVEADGSNYIQWGLHNPVPGNFPGGTSNWVAAPPYDGTIWTLNQNGGDSCMYVTYSQ